MVDVQEQILALLKSMAFHHLPDKSRNEEWLDSADVKRMLKIGDSALYRFRNQQVVPCKRIGKKWYYSRTALHELESSNVR